MFLDVGNFCSQMKAAYKNGRLDVGYINDGLFISSGHWVVWIDAEHVPNKIKALVVELAGDLPKMESAFTISKDYPTPQAKMIEGTYYDILRDKDDAKKKLIVTPITVDGNIRLLQNLNGLITCIREEFLGFIDPSAIDYSIAESQPIGPCRGSFSEVMYWYNDSGTVIIMPCKTKYEPLMDILEFIKFKEDGKIERCFREVGKIQEKSEGEPDSGEVPEQTEIQTENNSDKDDSEG